MRQVKRGAHIHPSVSTTGGCIEPKDEDIINCWSWWARQDTLAKAVYDMLKGDFNYGAFVPVGRNPDLKKVLQDILMDLDKQRRLQLSAAVLDERQLIDELRLFLKDKRYALTSQFRGFMLGMPQPIIFTQERERDCLILFKPLFKYF
jgi:hypothetical protein